MPGSSPERKYCENCVENKTGHPYVVVYREGKIITQKRVIMVVSCHRKMLGKCWRSKSETVKTR